MQQEDNTRCVAITKGKKGKRCARKATSPDGYCTQHHKMYGAGDGEGTRFSLPMSVALLDDDEEKLQCSMWMLGPVELWRKRDQAWGGAIQERLQEGPSAEKPPGWIYAYVETEGPIAEGDYVKIGMTTRAMCRDRVVEQSKTARLAQCWYVPFDALWYEQLIFALLHKVRVVYHREEGISEPYDGRTHKTSGGETEWFCYKKYCVRVCEVTIAEILRQLNE